jgi:site-specific DNA recombinase
MDRPGLRSLLLDIEAGRIDCVVVYKVDRLSRSLLDFARMMSVFEQHGVSFVSITQQFNTAVPVGRLTLNILLSFAAFERDIIRERTRDKKSAAKKKGKWTGGYVPLGYDLDPQGGRLIIDENEARQVREIFQTFHQARSLEATLAWVQQQGWKTKTWITRNGHRHAGRAFNEGCLVRLLRNETYAGWSRYEQRLYRGEHEAIIGAGEWKAVSAILDGIPKPAAKERNKHGALLKGLLHCASCGQPMTAYCARAVERRYRYYVCWSATCDGTGRVRYLSAEKIEGSVIEQLRSSSAGDRFRWDEQNPQQLIVQLRARIERIMFERDTGEVRIHLREAKREATGGHER